MPYGALYIHVPFCKKRCSYCDFETSAVQCDAPEVSAYVDNMILQIRRAAHEGMLANVKTVYIGGGTPTHIGLGALTQVCYTLSLFGVIGNGVECTVEANPESLDGRMVNDLWALGVNRISLGVQSLNDSELAALGRIHTAQDALNAIGLAGERFANVSVDLMCGIPHQTLASFCETLGKVVAEKVSHVSVYPLAVEEGTPMGSLVGSGELDVPEEDFQATCMEQAQRILGDAGFGRYEVASYAKPGFECRHNIAYWTGVPYLGLGPGAASMSQDANGRVRRKDGEIVERLDRKQALAEDLMLGMRLTDGVDAGLLSRARAAFPDADCLFDSIVRDGLAFWEGGRLKPSHAGWLLGNELYGRMLSLAP